MVMINTRNILLIFGLKKNSSSILREMNQVLN